MKGIHEGTKIIAYIAFYSRYVNSCYSDWQLNAEDLSPITRITKRYRSAKRKLFLYFFIIFLLQIDTSEKLQKETLDFILGIR